MSYEEMLKDCLEDNMLRDYHAFMDEVKAQPQHVFSKRFEERMKKVMKVKKKKGKVYKFTKKIVAAAVVVLALGGLMLTQEKSTEAGFWNVYYTDWLDEYFTMKQGDIKLEKFTFTKDMITYMPEGFECVKEESRSTTKYFVYSKGEQYIQVEIYAAVNEKWADSSNVKQNMARSEGGKIYLLVEDQETGQNSLKWEQEDGYFIQVSSNICVEEVAKILDGIAE